MRTVWRGWVCVPLMATLPFLKVVAKEARYPTVNRSEDVYLQTDALIAKYGYPAEAHAVLTDDGYQLTVHRIPGRRTPVLLQHGLLGSSADWVLAGPATGLGFVLKDAGYDVWLGNSRGNFYSQKHRTLRVKQKKFWDFSFHEEGIYDLPAVIDFMLNVTGHKSIVYIGHSMGTTMFFVMCSMRPEYNRKIRLMIALAPVAFMDHVVGPAKSIAMVGKKLHWVLEHVFRMLQLAPRHGWLSDLMAATCGKSFFDKTLGQLCKTVILAFTGFDREQLELDLLPVITGHYPAGTSLKTALHLAQLVKSNRFYQFDYGEKNQDRYRSAQAPDYNLSLVSAPVVLVYSANDHLSGEADVDRLAGALPRAATYRVPRLEFNHVDYLWGRDVKAQLYDYLVRMLRNATGVRPRLTASPHPPPPRPAQHTATHAARRHH